MVNEDICGFRTHRASMSTRANNKQENKYIKEVQVVVMWREQGKKRP